jgi:hypothetical protein
MKIDNNELINLCHTAEALPDMPGQSPEHLLDITQSQLGLIRRMAIVLDAQSKLTNLAILRLKEASPANASVSGEVEALRAHMDTAFAQEFELCEDVVSRHTQDNPLVEGTTQCPASVIERFAASLSRDEGQIARN